MKTLTLSSFDSPIGEFVIGGSEKGIYFIKLATLEESESWIKKWTKKHHFLQTNEDSKAFSMVKEEFHAYFNDELNTFTFKTDLLGTNFQKRVWNALTKIPYGQTWTYKDIAEKIEQPKAIRAVGGAINKNPISIAVPCHRVIGSDGSLTGYASGLDKKRYLLHHETKANEWLHLTS